MKCQECELLLAGGEISGVVDAHLAGCSECRMLAGELRENAMALESMQSDVMPVRPVRTRRGGWIWAGGAVAAGVILAVSLRTPRVAPVAAPAPPVVAVVPEIEPTPPVQAETPKPVRRRKSAVQPATVARTEPMMVKFLTPDPDVVIYWLIEPEQGKGAL